MKKFNKKKLIEYFLTDNNSGYKTKEKHVEKRFNGLLEQINTFNKNFDNIPFTQKLYNFLYEINEIPKCNVCGREIKWRNRFTEGYQKVCSRKCMSLDKERIEKIKQTNLKKYGVSSVSQVEKIKEKRKQTYKEKFGNENIFESKEIKEKTKVTNLKKYGTEYVSQSDIFKQKLKENNKKKYGVNSPNKLIEVKEKIKKTVIDRYGVDSVMKCEKIKNKNINTRTKDTITRYKEKLGNHIDVKYKNKKIIVKNQCELHPEYIIDKTLFYYRVLVHNITNPCIHCNPVNYTTSIKENEIHEFLNKLGVKTEKITINKKEIDIYLPEHMIGIEFNGLYWHSELFKENDYHINKTKFFKDKGINIIHIFEDEWVYKKEIVKSVIKAKIGLIDNKIYARKCIIKEIDNKTAENFLDNNHLQGSSKKSKYRIGLYYNDKLVSLMTFSHTFRGKKNTDDNTFELVRFCNKLDTNVIGGASKLLKYFIKTYNPYKIETFADRRYSNGKLYEKLGFKFNNIIPLNYWYFNRGDGIRYHRFNFRKSILVKEGYNINKTEHEIMLERGYNRIYDCGNIKYEMVINN
ncbi:MAG: DUF7487 domain-containing protein [bacterium]